MKIKKLHIVSFDVPFPPNYGGVIDVYYKCKYLHALGVEITLHCYAYGREEAPQLARYCKEVYYYQRKKVVNPLSSLPYIIASRSSKHLIDRLNQDQEPILFEGLHTTFPLYSNKVNADRCYVRTHNVEHEYYKKLEKVETNLFKRIFFRQEAKKLLKYEAVLAKAKKVFAISKFENLHFGDINKETYWISAFHESAKVEIEEGLGSYILYHGNLAVGENDHAACYLVKNVFSKIDFPCKIAGNNPSNALKALCAQHGVALIENKDNHQIVELIKNAQINVLVTFQKTGIKLKLLNALYQGRHCVVNKEMVEDTGIDSLCSIGTNDLEMIAAINQLLQKPFEASAILQRKTLLANGFDNQGNAQKLMELIG